MKYCAAVVVALGILLLPISRVAAEQIENLYTVAVPVQSQSSGELRRASADGLASVMVRVSGAQDVMANGGLAKEMSRAQQYLRQYRYQTLTPPDGEPQLNAILEFAPEQVDGRLRAAGLPVWSANRPSVLVWLVIEDRSGRRFVDAETAPEMVAALQQSALRRGLVIKLPLLDLTDTTLSTPDQLWRLDTELLGPAMDRYHSDGLLLGRATQLSTGRWLGKWVYTFNGRRVEFDGDGADAAAYMASIVDRVADLQARQFAISPVTMVEGGLLMQIDGLSQFTDYARVVTYLESLAAVRHANVLELDGERVIFQLMADGQLGQLQQVLELDKKLVPVSTAIPDSRVMLHYQWRGSR